MESINPENWGRKQEDDNHHWPNALVACEASGLDPEEYANVFAEISREWGKEGHLLCPVVFVNATVLSLCKSPEDLRRASKLFLSAVKVPDYCKFLKEIFARVNNGEIASLDELEAVLPEVIAVYSDICEEWISAGHSETFYKFYTPKMMVLCRDSEGFRRASTAILSAFQGVYGSGSAQFLELLLQEIETGVISSVEELESYCLRMIELFTSSRDELRDVIRLDGRQFRLLGAIVKSGMRDEQISA